MDNELMRLEAELMEKNNFRKTLGIEIVSIKKGYAVLALPIKESFLQAGGIVHGGVLSVMIDSVIGTAVRSMIDTDNEVGVTAEMNINYFRPVSQGKMIAEGKVINRGKILVVGIGEIKDENGKLLASGRATFVVREKKNL